MGMDSGRLMELKHWVVLQIFFSRKTSSCFQLPPNYEELWTMLPDLYDKTVPLKWGTYNKGKLSAELHQSYRIESWFAREPHFKLNYI